MTKKIAQNLSSTTLFNFTDQFHFLLGNLRNGFYCGDYYEKLPFTKNSGYKVPMVCFCDIPLGMVKVHLRWYGTYGIGIKRDYARFHNVCPVWYIHKDNPVIKSLFNSVNHNALKNSPILPYLKMFFGYQKPLNGIKEEQKKFYDEKEWRYIPQSMEWSSEFLRGTSHKNNAILIEDNKKRNIYAYQFEIC